MVSAERTLLERDIELEAIEDLIGAAASGGRLLAIEGAPGIGKTALIAAARTLAEAAGMRVLRARGSELEHPFSYGVVRQLFEPLLTHLAAEERAELLEGAAKLAAPLFDVEHLAAEPAADSAMTTLHGLYWLAANVSASQPLLLTIDDLQWCDLPSLRWLAYLLPRIEGLGVLVLVALRPTDPREDQGLVGQIVSDPVATTLRPAPLTAGAAVQVVRQMLSTEADDAFCAACQELTGGNPLLLRELLRTIADEHLALAQAVAVLGDDADPRQAATLAGLDTEVASEAASALARVEVLRPQPPLGFVHPLMRAAVYEAATPLERDGAHARAARLLADAGAYPERIAGHLLRSSPAADSQVVETLRHAARQAGCRGASESAVAYLRRALAEPPSATAHAELLLELGSAEAGVSGDAAIEHLQAAHALSSDPIKRAEIALRLGRQLFLLRGEDESDAILCAALSELGDADAEFGRLLEAGLISNGLSAPALYPAALERLGRVCDRPANGTAGQKLLLSLLASHDARAGAPASDIVPLARRALADGTLIREDPSGTAFVAPCSVLAMADLDEAVAIFDDALAEAHRRGSPLALAAVRVFRAQTLVWRGELADAEVDAREALAIADTWGVSARFAGHAAAFLADALMEQGKLDEAAAALAQAGRGEALAGTARLLYFANSRARLRILRGDLAGGAAEMLDAGRRYESVGTRNPAFIAWRSPAALAQRQLGEHEEAARLAAAELALARAWGAPVRSPGHSERRG
ncbi:MAG: AAA family ATPase [Actinomycetota bacterium]|nr:AAA family ATPase [Actinomycetota bacterium]